MTPVVYIIAWPLRSGWPLRYPLHSLSSRPLDSCWSFHARPEKFITGRTLRLCSQTQHINKHLLEDDYTEQLSQGCYYVGSKFESSEMIELKHAGHAGSSKTRDPAAAHRSKNQKKLHNVKPQIESGTIFLEDAAVIARSSREKSASMARMARSVSLQ